MFWMSNVALALAALADPAPLASTGVAPPELLQALSIATANTAAKAKRFIPMTPTALGIAFQPTFNRIHSMNKSRRAYWLAALEVCWSENPDVSVYCSEDDK